MEGLLRTRVDRFVLEDSLRLSEIEALRDKGEVERHVMPVDAVFLDLPKLTTMPGDGDKLVHNGNPFVPELAVLRDHRLSQARVYDSAGQFIGIYGYNEEKKRYQPQKVFLGGS